MEGGREDGWREEEEVGWEEGGGEKSTLNYSATATQVVTCARRFLQRFNPGPRDSARAFYSLLGAVAMGGCARWSQRLEKTVLVRRVFTSGDPSPPAPQLTPTSSLLQNKVPGTGLGA